MRLHLAQNDAQALELGNHRVVHNQVAPGLFIYLGLELEDLQCVFLSLFALFYLRSIQTSACSGCS